MWNFHAKVLAGMHNNCNGNTISIGNSYFKGDEVFVSGNYKQEARMYNAGIHPCIIHKYWI